MERRFRYIVLPADRLDRTVTVGLPQDTDDLLGTVLFLLYGTAPCA